MKNLIALLIIASPFFILYASYQFHLLKATRLFYLNRIKWKTPIDRRRYLEMDRILSERISFYQPLSDNGKAKFVHRLHHLLGIKKFMAKNGLVITDEMKVVVSAALVQLTYGLKEYQLDNVKGFVLYPTIFYHSMLKAYLRGGTPPEGMMLLSWKHVEKGFMIHDDKYNLGLHEMAHALKLSLKYAYDFDVRFANYLNRWKKYGNAEFLKMKRGDASFLREYGGTNEHEFFAVCVEHFFEVPEQFQYNLPYIYYHLCILLNQDPLNSKNDYLIEK